MLILWNSDEYIIDKTFKKTLPLRFAFFFLGITMLRWISEKFIDCNFCKKEAFEWKSYEKYCMKIIL